MVERPFEDGSQQLTKLSPTKSCMRRSRDQRLSMTNSLVVTHTEEDEEQEVSPESGLGRRTREKLTQIRKVVDAAKMSPTLNFAEKGDEEDE